MYNEKISTKFYGQNLVNLMSALYVSEINKIDKNHKTRINVIQKGNTITIIGKTTINSSEKNNINLLKTFNSHYSKVKNKTKRFNIIDLVTYESKIEDIPVVLEVTFHKTPIALEQIKNIVMVDDSEYMISLYGDNYVGYVGHPSDEILDVLTSKGCDILPLNDEITYISEDIYGMNLLSTKLYEYYFKSISETIFEKNICNSIDIEFYSTSNLEEINWETSSLTLKSKSNLVSDEKLTSMILDVFSLNPTDIINYLDLKDYDFTNEVTTMPRWKKVSRSKINELTIF